MTRKDLAEQCVKVLEGIYGTNGGKAAELIVNKFIEDGQFLVLAKDATCIICSNTGFVRQYITTNSIRELEEK